MVLVEAIRKVHRHYTLILIPIIYDFMLLAVSLLLVGFNGEDMISIRLILEMGLPSVSHLSNIPLFANNVDLLNIAAKVPAYTWIVVVTMIIIGAFLQGGYISFLYSIVKGQNFNFHQFVGAGLKNWLQFIFLEIIIFLGKIAVTAFLVLFFNIIGVFASLAFFICLRIIFIYLEFTIVVDKVSLATAMKRSRVYLKQTLVLSLSLIFIMYSVSSLLSLLLHWIWGPLGVSGLVFLNAFFMSVIQTAFISVFCGTRIERDSINEDRVISSHEIHIL